MARRRFPVDGEWWDGHPPPSRPIPVEGGIRAQTTRGRFAESWWAARWIAVLERFDIGARLTRGRSYARRGQVLSIDVSKGVVRARVQGSRTTPYDVTVKVRPLTPDEWTRVARHLASEAGYAARLLAGEMPRDIEQAFGRAGSSLFPEQSRELATACSCPDWSNPCKHVAAVYYLIGEEFDRDPFLLFTLRGRTRDEVLGDLARAGGRRTRARRGASGQGASTEHEPPDAESLGPSIAALDPNRFWQRAPASSGASSDAAPTAGPSPPVEAPAVHAELLRRLGRFPFWRGGRPPFDVLQPVYAAAANRALDLLTTSAPDDDASAS